MNAELKNKIRSDLENFRVWKWSFLLYDPSGTGKTSFVTAMARFLSYDGYDVNMSKVADDSDLKMLLLQTTPKSLIVMEDLDRFWTEKFTADLAAAHKQCAEAWFKIKGNNASAF
ncbi:hypothetical protein ACFX2G_036028 [Malus domestica]